MRECRARELPRGPLGEILLGHTVKIIAQKTLAQAMARAGTVGGARYAVDERHACGGDAAEQVVVFGSRWRLHQRSSWSRGVRCRVRVAHVVRVATAWSCGARLYMPPPPHRLRYPRSGPYARPPQAPRGPVRRAAIMNQ